MSVTTKSASTEVREYVPVDEQELTQDAMLSTTSLAQARKRRAAQAATSTQRWFTLLPPIILALILLISWYAGTTVGHVPTFFLPKISDVLVSLADGLGAGAYLTNALLVTVQESVVGFLFALIIALPLGYGVAKSRLIGATVQPYLAAGQAIPALVIAPFIVLWLGYGLFPNVVICALVVLFPIVINTILGVQTIDKAYTDAARVEGASGWSLLLHIEFPLALPAILAAIRAGFTLSITGAVVAEFVSGNTGLGSLVLQAKEQLNTPLMFATLFVLAILAALYYGATWLLVKLAEQLY